MDGGGRQESDHKTFPYDWRSTELTVTLDDCYRTAKEPERGSSFGIRNFPRGVWVSM